VPTATRVLASTNLQRGRRRVLNFLTEVNYALENDLELLSAAVSELRQLATDRWLFNDLDTVRFALAVDEALVNAYFHGNLELTVDLRVQDASAYYALADERRSQDPYARRRIQLRMEIGMEFVSVSVLDDGAGFDFTQLPDPTAPGYLERPCGRGVLLMRTFMDEVRFNDAGNQVTLIKRRSARTGDEAHSKEV